MLNLGSFKMMLEMDLTSSKGTAKVDMELLHGRDGVKFCLGGSGQLSYTSHTSCLNLSLFSPPPPLLFPPASPSLLLPTLPPLSFLPLYPPFFSPHLSLSTSSSTSLSLSLPSLSTTFPPSFPFSPHTQTKINLLFRELFRWPQNFIPLCDDQAIVDYEDSSSAPFFLIWYSASEEASQWD